MPRYTLTLIGSTNQTPPIVFTAESTRTIIRQLTKRLDPTPKRRRVQGSGGFTMERGRVKAFRELPPDPATGNRRRATAFGATRAEAERRLNEKIAELQRVGRLGYTKPPTVAEWCDHWLNDICKPHLKPRTWGTYASVIERNVKPAIGAVRLDELKPAHFPPHGTLRHGGAGQSSPAPRAARGAPCTRLWRTPYWRASSNATPPSRAPRPAWR